MNKIEIYIGTPAQYSLDVGDFDMSLNYSFNDVRDITKRNGSYSKTLTLPGTKNNNYVFGGLFDINSNYTLFNPNIKVQAVVVVNSKVVMNGFLSLNSIDKLNNVDSQGNTIYYNVSIFSKTIDLFETIGEKTVKDLGTLDQYNHTFSFANVIASWQHTYEDGYVYPMYAATEAPYANKWDIEHFHPALFTKAVIEAMVNEAGYSWGGSFKDNLQFQKEILPFCGGNDILLNETEIQARETLVEHISPSPNDAQQLTSDCNIGIGQVFTSTVTFNTVTTDVSNQYITVNPASLFTSGFYQDVTFNVNVAFRLEFTNSSNSTVTTDANNPYTAEAKIFVQVIKFATGATQTIGEVVQPDITGPLLITGNGTQTTNIYNLSLTTDEVSLEPGDQVRLIFGALQSTGLPYQTSLGIKQPINLRYIKYQDTSMSSTVNPFVLYQGSVVRLGSFFPNLKQKDILTDLIKRYNLLIYTDPSNPNLLIFDTYQDYFNNPEVLDWSDKKDYSREDNIEVLTDLQADKFLFTYTAETEKGGVNETYTGVTNEVFGQFELVLKEYASSKEEEIKSPFSPTPSIKTPFGAVLPYISRENPSGNQRVLHYSGLKDTERLIPYKFEGQIRTDYPYAGHLDDPFLPSLDLNFDIARYYFYSGIQKTRNNQYNTYWSAFMSQIQDGKLLTAYFNLNEVDIEKVKDNFSYKIWIKDAYYYINRIIDYNPLNNDVTKVELLKVNELGEYFSDAPPSIPASSNCPSDVYVAQQSFSGQQYYFYASLSGAAITQSCCNDLGGIWDAASEACFLRNQFEPDDDPGTIKTEAGIRVNLSPKVNIGDDNILTGQYTELVLDINNDERTIVYESKQFVIGDDNNVSGNNNIIVGDSNTVLNGGVNLINVNNTEVQGINITALGVNDQTLTESNSLYFGDKIRVETTTGKYYVDGIEVDVAHKISRRITSTELQELATNPIRLVPEVGPGKYPIIEDAALYMNTGSTLYNEDHILELYVDGAEFPYYNIENVLSAGTVGGIYHFQYVYEKKPDKTPYTHTLLNGGIFIRNSVDVTGGDLDIVVTVHYRIVDINEI